jgi:hypothetical protein
LGFVDVAHLLDETDRLSDLLDEGKPLAAREATRALAATEISFASDVFGAGVEWSTVTGLAVLRGLQRKLVSEYGSFFSAS